MAQIPQHIPVYPTLNELKDPSTAGTIFDSWESECYKVMADNDALFFEDLKVIKRCAFLRGFLGRPLSQHFRWCPGPHWESYWMEQGFPKLPNMD